MTIKQSREAANLTRAEMAKRYGIPLRTLEDWESGRRKPPEYVRELVIAALKGRLCIESEE